MIRDARRLLRSALRACACAVALAGCKQLTLDNPDPPNTAGLQSIYDAPPGELTAPDLDAVTRAVSSQSELLRNMDDFSLAQELLEGVSSNEDVVTEGDQIDPTAGARLLAVVKVKRICRGPVGDDLFDEEQFGSIDMTLKASPRGLFPIVWGRFNTCSDHVSRGALTLDGEYSITSRQEDQGVGFLFRFEGTIQSEEAGIDFEGTLDFRVRGDQTTELRIKASDGDVIVAVKAQGQLVVRDRSSEWACDPVALECTELSSGQVLSAERAQ